MDAQIKSMEQNIEKLSDDLDEVKGMMYQVKEAIMGNPVSGDGGLAGRLKKLEEKVESYDRLKWLIIGLAASAGFSVGELIDKFLKL